MPIGAFRSSGLVKYLAPTSRTAKTIARNVTTVSTAQSKFGGASAIFNGTSTWLDAGVAGDFTFSTGDFTVECWVRIAANSGLNGASQRVATVASTLSAGSQSNSWEFGINGSSTATGTGVYFDNWVGGAKQNYLASTTLSLNTWYHLAACKKNTSLRIFVNGTQIGSTFTVGATWLAPNEKCRIGSQLVSGYQHFLNGYIDEFRISNVAHYTANFTEPTAAFVNDPATTMLLMHMNGTNGSTTFTDDNA